MKPTGDQSGTAPAEEPYRSHQGHPRRWQILGVLVFSLFAIVLDNTILNVAIKTIADPEHGLGATQSELEWAINSYTLVFAGLLFTFGVLGDRYGRRRMLLIGTVLFGVASLASAYAQDPGQLIAARALMGLGGAAVMPATLAIISDVFPLAERGKAIGLWAAGVGIAVAVGPITGGLLLEHFWWGSVFLINVPVVVVGIVLIALLVPESKELNKGGLDPVGVLLSVAGLVSLVYGIIKAGELGSLTPPEAWAPALLGVLILSVFVWHERRVAHPAFDVRYFRDPKFTVANVSVGLVFFASMGVMFFLAFYWQIARGFTPLQSGALVLPFAVSQLIFAPRSAALVARYGAKLVGAVAMLVVAGSLAAYYFVGLDTPVWVVLLLSFVQGSAMASILPPATTAIMESLPPNKAGVGSAMSNTVRQVGGALGVAVLGSVLSASYRGEMADRLAFLPEDARHLAAESIAGTAGVAARLGAQGEALMGAASQAFVQGMHLAALGSAVVALAGALIVARWMPGKPKPVDRAETGARERVKVRP
ncbi:MFS transporter [Rhizohabitans arisaemae]|uniref:MFS transporter n=1 Tax=Rhizohabitans arisaemae TaxID=2720610 RepID=UPI0024B173D4|nr:MFS transporter [Rhizohabitans arisaemae]